MKKRGILFKIAIIILVIFFALISFISFRFFTAKLTYSNLVDEKTLTEVSNDLLAANVPVENVDLFKQQVIGTNKFLGDFHTFNNGFITIKKDGLKYDDYSAFNKFAALRVPYMDINCRIASWNLAGDLVNALPFKGDAETLFAYEFSTLHEHPSVKMTDADREKFYTLYAPIESDGFKFDSQNAKIIQNEWAKRNVSFKEDPNHSMINIFTYRSDKKTLDAVHSGVLIKRANDYLFIEKWNPTLPFQASIFKTRKDVKKYLDYRMNTSFLLDATIMENDKLFTL